MKNLIIVLTMFLCCDAIGQMKYDYTWLSGSPSLDSSSIYGVNVMEFKDGEMKIRRDLVERSFFGTNSSISDDDGNLLFYSNGCLIANKNHEIMENGDELNLGNLYSNSCPDHGYFTVRGSLTIPLPGDPNKYYIFYSRKTLDSNYPLLVYIDRIQYALVDMSLNNGLGKVLEKNQVIVQDTLYASHLTAVKHGNNQDWWVVTPHLLQNKYIKILFTSNGVESVTEQHIGQQLDEWGAGSGQACFSPDGTKYASYNEVDNVFYMDFDRNTGEFSNFQHFTTVENDSIVGGLAFSPNSRYLYASTRNQLWQFDTEANDIQSSKTLIAEYDGFKFLGAFAVNFYQMQLAPDCRIYMTANNGCMSLHVINYPDNPGLACGFGQRDISLPAINNASLPNFPNYRLGTPYPLCDSSIVIVSAGFEPPPPMGILVFPNPASSQMTVSLSVPLKAPAVWSLHNPIGQEVMRTPLPTGQTEYQIHLPEVPTGLYVWRIQTATGKTQVGKLVISK